MKKIIPFLLAGLCLSTALQAQFYDTDTETIVLSSPADGKPVTITPGEDYERGFSLYFGSYRIDFGDKAEGESIFSESKKHDRKAAKRNYRGKLNVIELGFNGLTSPDYTGFENEHKDFLDLKNGKSIYFALNLLKTSAPITRDGRLGFTTGLSMVWRNYSFDNPVTIYKYDGRIHSRDLDPQKLKKTKLVTFALDIPVMMDVNFGNFFFSYGVYGGVVIGSHTKYKKPKTKSRAGLSVGILDYGLTARLGHKNFYAFGNYGLNELFKSGTAPKTRTFTAGIGFPF